MTREETYALWRKCEDARAAALENGNSEEEAHEAAMAVWNAWANGMRARYNTLPSANKFAFMYRSATEGRRGWRRKHPAAIQKWLDEARADFANTIFIEKSEQKSSSSRSSSITYILYTPAAEIKFRGFIFPGEADFTEAEFRVHALFEGVKFDLASWFRDVIFDANAIFNNAKFGQDAWFPTSTFNKEVYFVDSSFAGASDFIGIKATRAFDMRNANFAAVPRFNQAHFDEAPDLDNVKIPLPSFWGSKTDNFSSNYRALRRIAIQGHDHEIEAKAFKGEIRSKRGTEHRPWHAAFWFGVFYDTLSDFGRSMMRPFWIWAFSIPAFATAYLANSGKLAAFHTSCADGTYIWLKGLLFALKNALLFINWDHEQIRSAYVCLYDLDVGQNELAVPATNALIQVSQSVWSAILIFLFLLALRNQFRIK